MPKVLCFDPSGNYHEGHGTSGWALFEDDELKDFGVIHSENYTRQEDYWYDHTLLINRLHPSIVVMESYRVFGSKAKQQVNSAMETPQLIGYIRMHLYLNSIKLVFQSPSDKKRVTDIILVREGIFEKRGSRHYCLDRPTIIHSRDAIRHGIFYHRYRKEKIR